MRVPEFWTFQSPDVAAAFDEHVREQLPWYDLVTAGVAQIGRHYIGQGGLVYDIGASTGNIGRALAPTLDARGASLVAVEASEDMAARYAGPGTLCVERAETVEYKPFDFAVMFLVLMFMRRADAERTLDRLLATVEPGGAVVVVERTLPPPGYPGVVTSRMALSFKRSTGVPAEEIVEKELSLAGAQRPLPAEVFTSRGAVEWFRLGDFAGYLLEAH